MLETAWARCSFKGVAYELVHPPFRARVLSELMGNMRLGVDQRRDTYLSIVAWMLDVRAPNAKRLLTALGGG